VIVRIRREADADIDAVRAVHTAAFAPQGWVDEPVTEAVLADRLRVDAAWAPRLTVVAEVDGVLAGAVTTSYGILAADAGAAPGSTPEIALAAVGPVGVHRRFQGRGVGSAMMHALVGAAEALDEPAFVLLGSPDFYGRFGFVTASSVGIQPPEPAWGEHFQVLPLTGFDPSVTGGFSYPAPFDGV